MNPLPALKRAGVSGWMTKVLYTPFSTIGPRSQVIAGQYQAPSTATARSFITSPLIFGMLHFFFSIITITFLLRIGSKFNELHYHYLIYGLPVMPC
jgi:hypothetical protein